MYRAFPADTTLEAARVQIEAYRKMGVAGRARVTFQLSDMIRRISEAGVRNRHPEYTEQQVKLAAIRLAIGNDLFRQAYPGVEVEA